VVREAKHRGAPGDAKTEDDHNSVLFGSDRVNNSPLEINVFANDREDLQKFILPAVCAAPRQICWRGQRKIFLCHRQKVGNVAASCTFIEGSRSGFVHL
jgi:hypothetical protein